MSAHGRILLVEAEDDIRRLLAIALLRNGYQVSAFASAEEFLTTDGLLRLLEFDLAIIDYKMGEMDGQELCLRIKAVRPELPVIIESGMPGQVFTNDCLRAGASQVLTKPFSVGELLIAIRSTLSSIEQAETPAPSTSDSVVGAIAEAVVEVVTSAAVEAVVDDITDSYE